MRITSVSAYAFKVPLARPFIIASGTMNNYYGVLVKVSANGTHGWGEASPSRKLFGENVRSAAKTIKQMASRLKGKTPNLDLIQTIFDPRNPSATAALDMAIHDLIGKLEGKPVRDFYTLKEHPVNSSVETSITISVGDLHPTLGRAQGLVDNGATTLKIKIGTNPDLDIERVKAVRNLFPKVKIRLDANQGYTEDQAVHVLEELEPLEIQFIEQPVKRQNLTAMAHIRKKVKIPVMADESLTDFQSLENIIENGAADMINIKIMKVGGISEGLHIAHRALDAGIGIMVGCMIETRVGITAGTHLALAEKSIHYTDLDGHLDLKEDFITGGVLTHLGRNRISTRPGLDLDVNEKTLSDYLTEDNDIWRKVLSYWPFSNIYK